MRRPSAGGGGDGYSVAWLRTLPVAVAHFMALGVLRVGWSRPAVTMALALFWARMFAMTGFDLTHYGPLPPSKLGWIWDLEPVPAHILEAGRTGAAAAA